VLQPNLILKKYKNTFLDDLISCGDEFKDLLKHLCFLFFSIFKCKKSAWKNYGTTR